ncbi:MAG: glycosyltransferase family 4 protein [Planctomycetales bacterium]|nr:glycosyltransferase family 4 protein [Planctomycetales bacterium]
MCRSLAKSGHEVHWVAACNEMPEYELIDGVHVHFVPRPTGRLNRVWRTARAVCRKATSLNGQLYHFHDPELIPFAAMMASKRRPVIYDAHEDLPKDLIDKEWIPRLLGRMIAVPIDWIERFGSFRFAAVIGAEEAIEQRFKRVVPKTLSIHNYPTLSDFPTPSYQPNRDDPTIVHFGGLSRLRAIEPLVESLGLLPPDLKLTLVAAGRCESDSLLERLQKMRGWRRVDYRGWLDHTEMRELLSTSTIAMNLFSNAPNNHRVRSNRFFESLASGVPVITSDLPAWKSIVDEIGCGLAVNTNDPKAIANAIQQIAESPDEAMAMAQNGRTAIEQCYNWELDCQRLIELYDEIISG